MMLPLQVTFLLITIQIYQRLQCETAYHFCPQSLLNFTLPFQPTNQPFAATKRAHLVALGGSLPELSQSLVPTKTKKNCTKRSFGHQKSSVLVFFSFVCWTNANRKVVKKKYLIRTQCVSYAIFVKSMIFVLYIISMLHLEYIYTNTCNIHIIQYINKSYDTITKSNSTSKFYVSIETPSFQG